MQQLLPRIQDNREIARGYFEMSFELPEDAQAPLPGQFLTIRAGEGWEPLLRRPFAYASWDPHTRLASIIYQKRGGATAILTGMKAGDKLDLLSPLGNRFPLPSPGRRPVLLAGGIGMGPVFFFARHLRDAGHSPLLVLGARDASLVPDLSRYTDMSLVVATDDGSGEGFFHGNAIQGMIQVLGRPDAPAGQPQAGGPELELYACGPHGMMKAAVDWAEKHGHPVWVSMEQTMGCAVGACMGCVVKVRDEKQYARVCSEGPVFAGGYIEW